MTTAIVKVPSTWMVLLPGSRWVNLAQIQQAEFIEESQLLRVTWANGDQTDFQGHQMGYLVQAIEESRNAIDDRVAKILVP